MVEEFENECYNECSNNNDCYNESGNECGNDCYGYTIQELFFNGEDISKYDRMSNGRYMPKYMSGREPDLGVSLFNDDIDESKSLKAEFFNGELTQEEKPNDILDEFVESNGIGLGDMEYDILDEFIKNKGADEYDTEGGI